MRQILQDLANGDTLIADVPAPQVRPGCVLIETRATLVSAGTERMLLEFGRAGIVEKMRQQPDKVRQVLEKIRTDGLFPTLEAVRDKLAEPLVLGYSNAGIVREVGAGVAGFAPGDRVASNGAHAEIVCVPANLCARIPDSLTDEAASFAVVGAIALQAIRLAAPALGESVAVLGLGLVGLVAVQLLHASGCRVLGFDPHERRCRLARELGAETVVLDAQADPAAAAAAFTAARGLDVVIIAASTRSSTPVSQSAQMCRKRGRIVLLGVADLQLSRDLFYEKELSFQVSCSYGPGRYDPDYELHGQDYPFAFVRWTAQRNIDAALEMMRRGAMRAEPLITHRFDIADAAGAYDILAGGADSLGIVLEYPGGQEGAPLPLQRTVALAETPRVPAAGAVAVGMLGAGNHASRALIPALRTARAELVSIASRSGVSGSRAGRRFGFAETTTDAASVIGHDRVNTVVVATRHDSHARYTVAALQCGKHVFVEKPLALSVAELAQIDDAYRQARGPLLMVGFNRRFAPMVVRMRTLLAAVREPVAIVITVNAGAVAPGHWVHDPRLGGGRIVGEACHFIDLARHLAASPISDWHARRLGAGGAAPADRAAIVLEFGNGSVATVNYLANGHRAFPKERIEVFAAGRVLQLDNFRRLRGWGWPGFRALRTLRQDKGVGACIAAFVGALRDGTPAPIDFDELMEVSRVSAVVADALRD